MKHIVATVIALGIGLGMAGSNRAEAATSGYFLKTYEVQVEYWFFDSDYYYWSTVYSTSDQEDAQFVYNLLLLAKQNGNLNAAAPNEYWRYIAVDVRLIVKYQYVALPNFSASLSDYTIKR